MDEILSNFFNGGLNDLLNFDRSHFYYNRPFYDQKPFYEIQKEDREILIVTVPGMEEKDITLELTKEGQLYYLTLDCERNNKLIDDKPFNLHLRWSIDKDSIQEDNIKPKLKNGLLYITLFYKKPEKTKIEINIDKE